MKYALVLTTLTLLAMSASCSPAKNAQAAKPEMTRCQDELNNVPEVAAVLRARARQPDDDSSLQGMEIALTIDRMVLSTADPNRDQDDWCYTENSRANFEKIVAALKRNDIPPTVDFLSGDCFDSQLQEDWLRSGNLIGSTTYTNLSVNKRTAQEFTDALAKNEQTLAALWVRFQRRQKYFRYPLLKLGLDEQRLKEVRAYLKQNGYAEVPATIASRDDYFSQPYCAALARGDNVCASFVAATFKALLLDKTVKARASAQRIARRDIKHILTIGASQLTCDLLDELIRSYKAMGVKFITLDEALADPFYATENPTDAANEIIVETRRAQKGMPPDDNDTSN